MALVYHHSSKNAARKYARTPNMEPNALRPNGGVTAMTVMNPGTPPDSQCECGECESCLGSSRPVGRNPFQWIEGRGVRHRHASPSYRSLRGAADWRKGPGQERKSAKLYAVDERGTVLSRPIDVERMAPNGSGEDMYNVEALRRAIRANARGMQRNYGYDPDSEDDDAVGEAMGSAYTETQRRAVRKHAPKRKGAAATGRMRLGGAFAVRQGRDGSVSMSVGGRKSRRTSRKPAAPRKTSRKGSKATSRKSAARKSSSKRSTGRKTSRSPRRSSRKGSRKGTSRKGSRKSATRRKSTSRKSTSRKGSKKSSARRTSARKSSRKGSKKSSRRPAAARAKSRPSSRTRRGLPVSRKRSTKTASDRSLDALMALSELSKARRRRASRKAIAKNRRTSRSAKRRTSRR
jgi:hypothetical protein